MPAGETIRLMPQLPADEEDTGRWQWNTGETTRDITVQTSRSYIYRVTYTNSRGIQSELCFPIAVAGDCQPDRLTPRITLAGETTETTTMDVLYGQSVTLAAIPSRGWGTYKWSTGATTESITKSVTADAHYTVEFKNQGGAVSTQTFSLHMLAAKPYVQVGTAAAKATSEVAVKAGQSVTLGLTLPTAVKAANVTWSDGTTGATLTIDGLQTSGTYTATFDLRGTEYVVTFNVFVTPADVAALEPGRYRLRHVLSDTYLTAHGKNQLVTFEALDESDANQLWWLERSTAATPKYGLVSLADADSLRINTASKLVASAYFPFFIEQAEGSDRLAIHSGATASAIKYWDTAADGSVVASSTITPFPYLLIPAGDVDGIQGISNDEYNSVNSKLIKSKCFDLAGRQIVNGESLNSKSRGVYIVNGRKILVK